MVNFVLKQDTVQSLEEFSKLLNKDINIILEEALESYFQEVQKKLIEKNQNDENAMTNLDYDEFWNGVDLD